MMDKTDKEYLVKVGYSKGGIAKRRAQYCGYNPKAIMRSSCAGSRESENHCRILLTEWGGQRITGTEWFIVPDFLFWTLYEKGMEAFKPKQKPIHFLEKF